MDYKFLEPQFLSALALGTVLGFSANYLLNKLHKSSKKNPTENNEEEETFEEPISTSNGHKQVCRMIIGVRTDLKMTKGKVAAQVAHAAVAAYVKSSIRCVDLLNSWSRQGQAKITVKIDDESQLLALAQKAKSVGVLVSIIRDAGHTQVDPDTRTVIAFGPAPKDLLDRVTGHLKLY